MCGTKINSSDPPLTAVCTAYAAPPRALSRTNNGIELYRARIHRSPDDDHDMLSLTAQAQEPAPQPYPCWGRVC